MENLSPYAKTIHDEIKSQLSSLLETDYESSGCGNFSKDYAHLLSLFDGFVSEYVKSIKKNISCLKGCKLCCNHWADDVYSFEAKIIARHLFENNLDTAPIIQSLKEDEALLAALKEAVDEKEVELAKENFDPLDVLFAAFYHMNRPCEFLNEQSSCTIYDIRPMICRAFINIGDPAVCAEEETAREDATMVIKLDEECEEMLHTLHRMHGGCDSDFGLRSQVRKYLEEGYFVSRKAFRE